MDFIQRNTSLYNIYPNIRKLFQIEVLFGWYYFEKKSPNKYNTALHNG